MSITFAWKYEATFNCYFINNGKLLALLSNCYYQNRVIGTLISDEFIELIQL